jgi:hypothetical protein
MRSIRRALVASVSLFLCVTLAGDSWADYIISGDPDAGGTAVFRARDDGTPTISYGGGYNYELVDLPGYGEVFFETVGVAHAVTPDMQTVYVFVNTLGYSDLTLAFDVGSGAYQPDKLLVTDLGASYGDDYILGARRPLIHGNDMFVLSQIADDPPYSSTTNAQIKRFDLSAVGSAEGAFVEAIDPPTPQEIYDITFGPDDLLYASAEDGVFSYYETPAWPFPTTPPPGYGEGFELVSASPLIAGVTGLIEVGSDGELYVLNDANGNIERYDLGTGAFIDTFLTSTSAGGDILAMDFGGDGNVHALVGEGWNYRILRVRGATGDVISTVDLGLPPDSYYLYAANAQITYIPVPEPAAGLLMLLGGAMLWRARRRER